VFSEQPSTVPQPSGIAELVELDGSEALRKSVELDLRPCLHSVWQRLQDHDKRHQVVETLKQAIFRGVAASWSGGFRRADLPPPRPGQRRPMRFTQIL